MPFHLFQCYIHSIGCFQAFVLFGALISTMPAADATVVQPVKTNSGLCGAECLYIALRTIEKSPPTFRELLEQLGPVPDGGFSMSELQRAAEKNGAFASCVQISWDQLANLSSTHEIILHIVPSHYEVCSFAKGDEVVLSDGEGMRSGTKNSLLARWKGKAIVISSQPLDRTLLMQPVQSRLWLIGSVVSLLAAIGIFAFFKLRR